MSCDIENIETYITVRERGAQGDRWYVLDSGGEKIELGEGEEYCSGNAMEVIEQLRQQLSASLASEQRAQSALDERERIVEAQRRELAELRERLSLIARELNRNPSDALAATIERGAELREYERQIAAVTTEREKKQRALDEATAGWAEARVERDRYRDEWMALSQDDGKAERALERTREQLEKVTADRDRYKMMHRDDYLGRAVAAESRLRELQKALQLAAGEIQDWMDTFGGVSDCLGVLAAIRDALDSPLPADTDKFGVSESDSAAIDALVRRRVGKLEIHPIDPPADMRRLNAKFAGRPVIEDHEPPHFDELVEQPKVDCEKCGGAGWLRGSELDDPSEDTYADTMTKYPCDGEAHKRQAQQPPRDCDAIDGELTIRCSDYPACACGGQP